MYPAAIATTLNSRTVPAKVAGSVGTVPYSSDAINFVANNDVSVPNATPATTKRSVFVITLNCTRPAVAPSAIRMPISCVCRVTE
jgi:hypothetical protein